MTEPVPAEIKAKVLRRGVAASARWLDVTGLSMGPDLPGGSRVLVDGATRPRRGEVWAFVGETGEVVVHRFLRDVGGQLWFRGDANVAADRPVPPERLIGRVTAVEVDGRRRDLGRVARWRGRLAVDRRAIRRRLRRVLRQRSGNSRLPDRQTLAEVETMEYESPAIERREAVEGMLFHGGGGS